MFIREVVGFKMPWFFMGGKWAAPWLSPGCLYLYRYNFHLYLIYLCEGCELGYFHDLHCSVSVLLNCLMILCCLCSLPVPSNSESSNSDATGGKQLELIDDHVRNSGSGSPVSVSASELQLNGKREGSSPENLDNFANIGLVQDTSQPYVPPDSQQQQDASELQSFSVSLFLIK